MGASIDGEEDRGGDDEPPHPRPGHRIATPEIRHHCKWIQQGQRQKRHMIHDLAGHTQPPQGPSRKRRTEAPPSKLLPRSQRGQDPLPGPTFYLQEVSSRGTQRNGLPREVLQDMQTNRTRDEQMQREKACNLCGGEGHTYYQCPKSDRPRTNAAAAAGTPARKTTRPKLDPTANAKVNALLKASREEAQKIPEPTRRSNLKGPGPQDHKSPGPNPEVEPTRVTDPAPPTETTVSVDPTHPEGTHENGTPTNAPPLEAQGEPEPTPETRAEEGKESMAAARTPTPTPAPAKAKSEKQTPKEESGLQQQGRRGD
ncbi:hypothetical protein NDU88_001236 [Pleurodeles waltl]|uniref:CCHC-type domain-containing protein n=1 Tax=Pleurodeles waltl TaxID=8319 RepID=A0AAV7WHR7_PLEWA|nr:hypothetical protein NDU88_001236 [Pleurodeles waltl]